MRVPTTTLASPVRIRRHSSARSPSDSALCSIATSVPDVVLDALQQRHRRGRSRARARARRALRPAPVRWPPRRRRSCRSRSALDKQGARACRASMSTLNSSTAAFCSALSSASAGIVPRARVWPAFARAALDSHRLDLDQPLLCQSRERRPSHGVPTSRAVFSGPPSSSNSSNGCAAARPSRAHRPSLVPPVLLPRVRARSARPSPAPRAAGRATPSRRRHRPRAGRRVRRAPSIPGASIA